MAERTRIEWCDHTWSPWEGCTKVSPACDHCYAEARNQRFAKGANWGPGAPRRRTVDWSKPLAWDKAAARAGRRDSVFPSLCDPFDNEVDLSWRDDLFALIGQTPNLDWLLLTKRIGNAGNMLPVPFDFDRLYPNVWLGATICNQAEADRDIPKLLALPASVRFLSIEPMLGPIDLSPWLWGCETPCADCPQDADCVCGFTTRRELGLPSIGWVICGGESGPHARPMHPDWVRSLEQQCRGVGTAFFMKQWGEWMPIGQQAHGDGPGCSDFPGYAAAQRCVLQRDGEVCGEWPPGAMLMRRVGKKAAGRLLDGRTHDEFPGDHR